MSLLLKRLLELHGVLSNVIGISGDYNTIYFTTQSVSVSHA